MFARSIALVAVMVSLAGVAFGINAAADSTASNKAGKAAESSIKCAACCQAGNCDASAQMTAAKPCCEDAATETKPERCPECAAKAGAGPFECAEEPAAKTEKPVAADDVAEAVTHGPGFMRGRGPGLMRGRGFGPGGRFGFGPGAAAGHDDQFTNDHFVFFYLLDNRKEIRRKVTNLPDGIETLTESDDPAVAAKIQEHVAAMYERVENQQPIHMRDPLFREIFANAKKIKMEMKETEHGILVKETSEDPYVAKLLHEHGKVVSLFLKNGHAELPRNHEVPAREAAATEK